MKRFLISIPLVTLFVSLTPLFAQTINVSGIIVDENGNPVSKAIIEFKYSFDSTYKEYSNKNGLFKIHYKVPKEDKYFNYNYSLSIQREAFLYKTLYFDYGCKDIIIDTPIVIRSRKGFWYNSAEINSTHVGMTVRQAISKYKLDIEHCNLWDEPPFKYFGFSVEFADSSEVGFRIHRFENHNDVQMKDILDSTITGIKVIDKEGNQRSYGMGYPDYLHNYYYDSKVEMDENKKKKQ